MGSRAPWNDASFFLWSELYRVRNSSTAAVEFVHKFSGFLHRLLGLLQHHVYQFVHAFQLV
jgi:hypothetical protein